MPRFTGQDLTCVRGERRVFQGLDFAVEAGAALVLTGPNGSGKSSLLRLMAGLLRPARGVLAWDGEAIGREPDAHRARLVYVGHLDAVKPALTVAENVAFWAALGGAAADSRAIADGALEAFGLIHLAAMPARFLSAGQKRRVNLARIIAVPAELWLLDEPAAALDAQASAGLTDAIARHRAGGGMAVVATHTDIDLEGAQGIELTRFADGGAEASP